MSSNRVAVLALAGTVLAGVALACGPDFPWQLFQDRKVTLATAPVNSFTWEAQHLGKPSAGGARAVENPDVYGGGSDADWLARQHGDAAAALVAAGEPADIAQSYQAGATAFAGGDWREAADKFATVVALPDAHAAPRALWAEFMLGRALAKSGDRDGALAALAKTREMAAHGLADPLGLAAASLGEAARLRLEADNIPGAVALYAEQAADGSGGAVQSLRMVAEQAMTARDRLKILLRDALTQRLLVAYALGQAGDYLIARLGDITDVTIESASAGQGLDTAPLRALVQAINDSGAVVAEPDRLAALMYRIGDYGAARGLAEKADGPLALWVRAKLALHDGNNAAAAAFFAGAVQAAKTDGGATLEESSQTLLQGETGTLALVRGDFGQAMAVLWPLADTYWGDVAYLAERVLSVDELKAFADANAAKPAHVPTDGAGGGKAPQLRNLLARRLMRAGRFEEAIPYFTVAGPDGKDLRVAAAALADSVRRAEHGFWATGRAAGAWRSATLLRNDGMELVGTEIQPDEAALDGEFADGYGPPTDSLFKQPGTFTVAEQARHASSEPAPDARFHYRYLAADQAVRAAEDVPARSQAYAALLCHAAAWMLQTDEPAKARAIYRLYVQNGAVVPFATDFGHHCPAPDFAAAPATQRRLLALDAKSAIHRHKYAFLAFAGLGIGLAGLGVAPTRRSG
jgi:hypothetical protein